MSTNLQNLKTTLEAKLRFIGSAYRGHLRQEVTKASVEREMNIIARDAEALPKIKDLASLQKFAKDLESRYPRINNQNDANKQVGSRVMEMKRNVEAGAAALNQNASQTPPAAPKTEAKEAATAKANVKPASVQSATSGMEIAVGRLAQASFSAGLWDANDNLNALSTKLAEGKFTPAQAEMALKSVLLDLLTEDPKFPPNVKQGAIDNYNKAVKEFGEFVYPKEAAKDAKTADSTVTRTQRADAVSAKIAWKETTQGVTGAKVQSTSRLRADRSAAVSSAVNQHTQDHSDAKTKPAERADATSNKTETYQPR